MIPFPPLRSRAARWGSLMVLAAVLGGCAVGAVDLPPAILYDDCTVPLVVRTKEAEDGVAIPADLVRGVSRAYRVAPSLPGIPGGFALSVGWGEMALQEAMENGGLAEVTYADARNQSYVFGVYKCSRVIAYGPPKQAPPAASPPAK